jgi:hypothetical protein
MGKPYGLGDADIRIVDARIEGNEPKADGSRDLIASGKADQQADRRTAERYADRFVDHMNTVFEKEQDGRRQNGQQPETVRWERSEQIEALIAMAEPPPSANVISMLRYMRLDPEHRINEFQVAKSNRAVLPHYGPDPIRDELAFPRNSHGRPRQGGGGAAGGWPAGGGGSGGASNESRGGVPRPQSIPAAIGARVRARTSAEGTIEAGPGEGSQKGKWQVRFDAGGKPQWLPAASFVVIAPAPPAAEP